MTATFDFAAQQVTPETTREYTFDFIPGAPSIVTRPAHDSNPAFLDARLRYSIEQSEQLARGPRQKAAKQTPDAIKADIESNREVDRKIMSEACASGWGTAPVAADGSTPEFTAENCYAFFKALPDWMFDPYRSYVGNLYNFVERPPLSAGEARDLGNS